MKNGQKFLYSIYCIGISISLAVVEYFVLKNYVGIFSNSWKSELVTMLFVIFFINPVLDKLIMDKIPFKVKDLVRPKIKKTNPHDIKA